MNTTEVDLCLMFPWLVVFDKFVKWIFLHFESLSQFRHSSINNSSQNMWKQHWNPLPKYSQSSFIFPSFPWAYDRAMWLFPAGEHEYDRSTVKHFLSEVVKKEWEFHACSPSGHDGWKQSTVIEQSCKMEAAQICHHCWKVATKESRLTCIRPLWKCKVSLWHLDVCCHSKTNLSWLMQHMNSQVENMGRRKALEIGECHSIMKFFHPLEQVRIDAVDFMTLHSERP